MEAPQRSVAYGFAGIGSSRSVYSLATGEGALLLSFLPSVLRAACCLTLTLTLAVALAIRAAFSAFFGTLFGNAFAITVFTFTGFTTAVSLVPFSPALLLPPFFLSLDFLLSVTYQPLPLKWMAGRPMSRTTSVLPQFAHAGTVLSEND